VCIIVLYNVQERDYFVYIVVVYKTRRQNSLGRDTQTAACGLCAPAKRVRWPCRRVGAMGRGDRTRRHRTLYKTANFTCLLITVRTVDSAHVFPSIASRSSHKLNQTRLEIRIAQIKPQQLIITTPVDKGFALTGVYTR